MCVWIWLGTVGSGGGAVCIDLVGGAVVGDLVGGCVWAFGVSVRVIRETTLLTRIPRAPQFTK